MIKVLFVCHGNICRSPMAEFMFKDLLNKNNLSDKFHVESRATSYEEIGNGIHYGTKRILDKLNIKDYHNKKAQRMTIEDYNYYDYIIAMDSNNIYNLERIQKDTLNKYSLLLDYTDLKRNISDPWYTGDFNKTYEDISIGLEGFLKYLKDKKLI